MIQGRKALIVIDMQNDFMDNGSFSVPGGNEIIGTINALMELEWGLIVGSQDWHPEDHMAFAANNPGMEVNDTLKMVDGSGQHM
ncbi:MAG: isochorismatase family protein [Crocinitomicaceae bacterium]|nr:isochorismatase family protein [Crocinitomicaceae bacterium]